MSSGFDSGHDTVDATGMAVGPEMAYGARVAREGEA